MVQTKLDIVKLLETLNVRNLGMTYAQSPVCGSAYGYDTHARLWLTIPVIIVSGRRFIAAKPMGQTIGILQADPATERFVFHPHFLEPWHVEIAEVLTGLETLLSGRRLRVEHDGGWTEFTPVR